VDTRRLGHIFSHLSFLLLLFFFFFVLLLLFLLVLLLLLVLILIIFVVVVVVVVAVRFLVVSHAKEHDEHIYDHAPDAAVDCSRGIVASVKPFGIFVDIFEVPQLHLVQFCLCFAE